MFLMPKWYEYPEDGFLEQKEKKKRGLPIQKK